jgi:iron only hydrogenase large subunit-like protein
MDKSFILDVVDLIKKSDGNKNYPLYAVVAPSISSQFTYAKLGQVISGIKRLGFFHVVEAALGADLAAYAESKELVDKGFLMSSCCLAFVDYVHKQFPALAAHISHSPSPMAAIAQYIKRTTPDARIVFIGPCTAKKMEFQKDTVRPYVDCTVTFEELQALLDSQYIDITKLEEDVLDNASYYGRIFARSGGLADAVRQGLKERGLDQFEYRPVSCDGIESCRISLAKASRERREANFIEGMACVGGCIGGAGCLTHGEKDKREVDEYGMETYEKKISDAISVLK